MKGPGGPVGLCNRKGSNPGPKGDEPGTATPGTGQIVVSLPSELHIRSYRPSPISTGERMWSSMLRVGIRHRARGGGRSLKFPPRWVDEFPMGTGRAEEDGDRTSSPQHR